MNTTLRTEPTLDEAGGERQRKVKKERQQNKTVIRSYPRYDPATWDSQNGLRAKGGLSRTTLA